ETPADAHRGNRANRLRANAAAAGRRCSALLEENGECVMLYWDSRIALTVTLPPVRLATTCYSVRRILSARYGKNRARTDWPGLVRCAMALLDVRLPMVKMSGSALSSVG